MTSSTPLIDLHIHGAWSSREEDVGTTAEKLVQTFKRLGELSEHWSSWFKAYKILEDRERPAVLLNDSPESVAALLDATRIEDDPGLGLSIEAFAGPVTGTRDDTSRLKITCCKRGEFAGPNVISLRYPMAGVSAARLREVEAVVAAVLSLAHIWDPDWISARNLLSDSTLRAAPLPPLGWVTYLSAKVASFSTLPHGWSLRHCDSTSPLIVYDRGVPSGDNALDREAIADCYAMIQWTS